MPLHQTHPLELLRDLNNQDKHQQGLWVAPILGPDGIHELAQMQIVMSPEHAAALQRQPPDPNEFIDINPRPLSDGATVLRTRLPEGVDVEADVTVAALSVPLTLALVAPDPASDGYPLLRELGEALAFTRSIIWWVAGVTDTPPQPVRRWATHA